MKGKVTIERALSKLGLASRAQTRKWVLEGRLSADEEIVKDPLAFVVPELTRFALDGTPFIVQEEMVVFLHKVKGVVTTRSDEKGRKTIYDLLPSHLHNLHPVGRLDMHTTGLLILTNNTKLSSYLTNPAHKIERTYVVSVRGKVEQKEIDLLIKGVEDRGELLRAKDVHIRKKSHRESHLIVTLVEGKNREIRRMFTAICHEVLSLKRISFGPFHLGDLAPGKWVIVPREEVSKLR
jgi:23S rRNA pseudouridine2605 synthase